MDKPKQNLEKLSQVSIGTFRKNLDLKVQLERGDLITVYLETKRSREDPHFPAVVWQARGFQIKSSSDRPPLGHKLNAWVDKWFGDEIFKRACVELLSESFDVLNHCMVQQVEFDRGAEVIVSLPYYGTQKKVTLKKLLEVCIFSNSFSFEDTKGRFWLASDILAVC